jgi:membrane-associated phospholipid phosphatase
VLGLRAGTLRALDMTQLMGIVTFPSYHAALALIFVRAFRDVPGLAIAGALWATLTIVATPVFGGHYLVDVLAGLALGWAGLMLAPAVTRLRGLSRIDGPAAYGLRA